VPLLLMGYGPDLIAHLLLLMTLAAQGVGAQRAAEPSLKGAPPAPAGPDSRPQTQPGLRATQGANP
jgi:hypothetical protein